MMMMAETTESRVQSCRCHSQVFSNKQLFEHDLQLVQKSGLNTHPINVHQLLFSMPPPAYLSTSWFSLALVTASSLAFSFFFVIFGGPFLSDPIVSHPFEPVHPDLDLKIFLLTTFPNLHKFLQPTITSPFTGFGTPIPSLFLFFICFLTLKHGYPGLHWTCGFNSRSISLT